MPLFDIIDYLHDDMNPLEEEISRAKSYGLNANFVILGLIVLLYKIKYLNFANFYISRLYLVLRDVFWLMFIIVVVQFTFAYSYKIIYEIDLDHL